MNKKVIRCVIAIGMVIIGVLFICAIWNKRELPKGKFATQWDECVKMLDVPIEEVAGPAKFTLAIRPKENSVFDVLSIRAGYGEDYSTSDYPEPPLMYDTAGATVSAIAPIVDDKPALLIDAKTLEVRSRGSAQEMPGGKCILVPNGDLHYYEVGNGAPKKLAAGEVDAVCAQMGRRITFRYPTEKTLTKGTTWTIPAESGMGFDLPCEIAGYATVAGRKTAKILGQRHLTTQELAGLFDCLIEQEKKLSNDPEIIASIRKASADARKAGHTRSHQIVAYVDLETGLVLHQDFRMTIHRPNAPNTTTAIISLVRQRR